MYSCRGACAMPQTIHGLGFRRRPQGNEAVLRRLQPKPHYNEFCSDLIIVDSKEIKMTSRIDIGCGPFTLSI